MEELRQSNQELLKKLKIGQAKAWDILHKTPVSLGTIKTHDCTEQPDKLKRPYTFSTPTKTYLHFLDKAGNQRYNQVACRNNPATTGNAFEIPGNTPLTPLSDILNTSASSISSSTYGRPHKTPLKYKPSDNGMYNSPIGSPLHSPYCTENHREKLHHKLNASYSKLAADLKQIAPHYGADLAFDLSDNSRMSIKPDSYYDEIKKFRMANSELCSVKLPDYLQDTRDSRQSVDEENQENAIIEEKEHRCVQTYTVGLGYRAADSHSGTQCPLCIGADDTKHRGLIRVNIAHDDLVDYKVIPKRADDSVSLSSHCSLGWENAMSQYKTNVGRAYH